MAHRKKGNKLKPAVYKPVEAVVLCLDSSKKLSGYGILVPEYDEDEDTGDSYFMNSHEVQSFGTAEEPDQLVRRHVVEEAAGAADSLGVPLVVAAEMWSAGGKNMTFKTYVGLGVGWGLWLSEFYACNIPVSCIWRMYPQQWRGRLLGGLGARDSDSMKKKAQQAAIDAGLVSFMVGHDIADALCIGHFATTSQEAHDIAARERRRFQRKGQPDCYLPYEEDEGDDDDELEDEEFDLEG